MRRIFPRVTRRAFLQATAGATAGVAASGVTAAGVSTAVQALTPELRPPDGPESWVTTTCMACPAACGMLVRKIGDRAVYVKGNPAHPVSRGGLCPRALASLQLAYCPDRLRTPLRRRGENTSGGWEEISWDEALGEIGERWSPLLQEKSSRRLAFLGGRRSGLLCHLLQRFISVFPGGRLFALPPGTAAFEKAVSVVRGGSRPLALDFESARYVLNFGCNLLEGWGSPVAMMRAYAGWRDASRGQRSKLVHVGPRLSVTGARADEWVPVRPGMAPIVALGIAHVLLAENLYDRDFVARNTLHFEDWDDSRGRPQPGFRSQVLRNFRLSTVASLTDVPVETILRLAREFAANRPALALGDASSSFQPGSLAGSLAVHSLNLLLGSSSRLVREAPQGTAPGTILNAAGDFGRPVENIGELWTSLESGKPYQIDSLFVSESNPVVQLPGGQHWQQALARVPFLVVSAAFLDETAAIADLVLPSPTFLEAWDEAATPPGCPLPVESVVAPVIAPRGEARHVGDVILALVQRLGGPLAEALPFQDFAAVVSRLGPALFEQRRGYVFGSTLEAAWYGLLQRTGWWAPTYSTAEELWQQMTEHGGWWDPGQQFGAIFSEAAAASAKNDFLPANFADWPAQILASASARIESHPVFPLILEPFEVLPLLGGLGAESPFLAQSVGHDVRESWTTWVELNPETAAQLGVTDHQWVWVESARGRIRVKARLRAGVHPHLAAVPIGLGRTAGSGWSRGRGANPADLIDPAPDPQTDWPRWWGERVRISPV